jgi:uncharacterized Rossmann fold enzyme
METAIRQRLHLDVGQFGVAAQHRPAILAAMARGLPEFAPALVAHDGTMVIAGSGPSLPAFIDEIRAEQQQGRPICAVNGAHDFLCEQGIVPELFLTVDPRDLRHNLRHKNEDTIYLLASRVAPEVFDHLKDCRVMLWHSAGHPSEMPVFEGTGVKKIGGGSTSGLRAIAVTYLMGFRKMLLFGFDSCNDAEGRKRFDSGTVTVNTDVIVGGRTFVCSMAMAAQANEFQMSTYGMLPGLHLEVKGDGLIAAMLEERRKAGYRV